MAANFLEAKSLLDLCCAKVASMIKGKTPEQIRDTFNIDDELTAEEEAAVRAENAWAKDMQSVNDACVCGGSYQRYFRVNCIQALPALLQLLARFRLPLSILRLKQSVPKFMKVLQGAFCSLLPGPPF
eukprot:g37916.t1